MALLDNVMRGRRTRGRVEFIEFIFSERLPLINLLFTVSSLRERRRAGDLTKNIVDMVGK